MRRTLNDPFGSFFVAILRNMLYNKAMKFAQLAKSLKEQLSPVYFLEGDEAYFRDHAVKSIREACAISQPTLNELRVDGETLKGDRLTSFRDELYTLPFFDARRLVRVYEFYPTEREWDAVLEKYCASPCETTVLVIVNRGRKPNTADIKKKKGVVYVDCSREDEEMLARWLFALMRRSSLNVSGDVAALMVRYCNRDCARMRQETEKLRLILGEGGTVTQEVVEENVAKDVEYKIYELTQAASRKNFSAFSEILSDLMEKGYDEHAALASLTSHFRTLTEVMGIKSEDEAAKVLGLKPYAVRKNRETAARLGEKRVRELYEKLFALSCGAKQGIYGKSGALSLAIAEIFFGS